MARPRSRRGVCALAIALLAATSGLLLSAGVPQHAAAAGGTMTATPSTNVADGEFVKLDLNGFPPTSGVPFRECVANPVNVATDCTPINNQVTAITDAAGSSETYLPLYSGSDSHLANAGHTGAIICDDRHPCVVAGVTTTTDLANAVFAPVSFAPSTDVCPDPGASATFGTGSATAYRALYAWQAQVCTPPASLPIVYAVSNGVDGVDNFGQGQAQANFGVTGPLPPISLPSTAPAYKAAPITGSGVVLAYRMYDRRGPQITTLTLTPWEIAQNFRGQLTDYNTNPGVQSLNPTIEFPSLMQAYSRAEHSSETWVFTSWLFAMLGPGSWSIGPTTTFPSEPGVVEVSGSRGVGFAVANPQTTWFNQGNMGFMDSSTAAYYGLPTVRIRLDSGAIVAATPTSIAQGLAEGSVNPDGSFTPNYAPSDPSAWPMSIASSMLVPTDQIAPAQGKTLAAFLKYAVQQGQTTLPPGYVPLPALMVNQSLAAAGLIPQTVPASSAAGGDQGVGGGGGGEGLPSFGNDQTSLGGLGSPGSLNSALGDRQTIPAAGTTQHPSAGSTPGGSATETASVPSPLLVGSEARWTLLAIAIVAAFGVVVGPLTYLLARPWPPPFLRRLLEVMRLRASGMDGR